MLESKSSVADQFTSFLRTLLINGAVEVGISEVLRPFALELKITFEAARDAMYAAIAARLVELTEYFKLKPVG